MSLEGRVLSDAKVREAAKGFLCVKVDPRSPGDGRDALRHKTTRYVPELVLLDRKGEAIETIENAKLNPTDLAETLRSTVEDLRR